MLVIDLDVDEVAAKHNPLKHFHSVILFRFVPQLEITQNVELELLHGYVVSLLIVHIQHLEPLILNFYDTSLNPVEISPKMLGALNRLRNVNIGVVISEACLDEVASLVVEEH